MSTDASKDRRAACFAEVLRTNSADYLVSVDSFGDAARELVYRIEHDAPEVDRESAHQSYLRDW
jgi:hypothetical protein